MSVLVVGISHKSAPVALLERLALDADGVDKLVARRGRLRARHRGDRDRHLQPARDLRRRRPLPRQRRGGLAAARRARRRVHRGAACRTSTSTTTTAPSPTSSTSPPASTRWSSARARSSARPARRCGSARSSAPSARPSTSLFQQALRVGKRAHAETDIDRAAPSLVTRRARAQPPAVGRRSRQARRGRRRRRDGRPRHRDRLPARRRRRRRRQPHRDNAERLAARVRRPRRLPLADLDRPSWPTPTWSSPAPAPPASLVTRDAMVDGPRRRRAAARDRRPRAAARRRARRSPTLPGVTPGRPRRPGRGAPRLRRGPRGRGRARASSPRRSPPSSPPAARPASPRPWSRCARWPPRSSTPRWSGSPPGCPTSTTPTRAEVLHTVRRVADKLLHQPTVRVKELANETGAVSYAAALAELFALDPDAVDAVTRAGVPEEGRHERT